MSETVTNYSVSNAITIRRCRNCNDPGFGSVSVIYISPHGNSIVVNICSSCGYKESEIEPTEVQYVTVVRGA